MKPSEKTFYFLVLLLVAVAGGCSQTNTQTSEPLSIITPISVVTETPTLVPSPTPTNIVDLTNLTTKCVDYLDAPPNNVELKNSLVLSSISSKSYILNLETNEKMYLEGDALEIHVSPDMQKLAYINYDPETLVIKDGNGRSVNTFNGYDSHFSLIEWLDNENLAINKALNERPPFFDYSLYILNSLTGANKELYIEDFPNGNRIIHPFSWGYFGNLIPNPQLSKLIYPVYGDGDPVVLWDMNSSSELRRWYFDDSLPAPQWSSDGTKFLISAPIKFNGYVNFDDDLPYQGGNDLFIINDNGTVKRLTFLSTKYNVSVYRTPSWSPTEDHIAFDIQFSSEPNFGLSVLNTSTGEVTTYCIQDNWANIYWSPDGKQIAFTSGNGSEPSKSVAYILDLEKTVAFKIADDMAVEGWIVNE